MPVALIALCALPLTAGAVRLVTLAVGVEITPEAGVTAHILARGLPTANDAIRAVHGGEDPVGRFRAVPIACLGPEHRPDRTLIRGQGT